MRWQGWGRMDRAWKEPSLVKCWGREMEEWRKKPNGLSSTNTGWKWWECERKTTASSACWCPRQTRRAQDRAAIAAGFILNATSWWSKATQIIPCPGQNWSQNSGSQAWDTPQWSGGLVKTQIADIVKTPQSFWFSSSGWAEEFGFLRTSQVVPMLLGTTDLELDGPECSGSLQ